MAKLHFRPYILNQTVLFPQRIDENIAANNPVHIVNAVVDNSLILYRSKENNSPIL